MRERYRRLLGRDRARDVDEEIAFHLAMRAREARQRGEDPERARQLALQRFGSVERARAACLDIDRRKDRRMARSDYLSDLLRDLAFTFRSLARSPAFAALAVATLALGIGGNTAVFSVVRGVILKPLPYPDAERVVYPGWLWGGGANFSPTLTTYKYAFLRENARSFQALATFRGTRATLGDGEATRSEAGGLRVDRGFFDVFGTHPTLGRAFTAEEQRPGGPPVVILSQGIWRSRFGGDPGLVGRTVLLDGEPFTVVGIMPAGYRIVEAESYGDFLLPMRLQARRDDGGHNTFTVARLAPGVPAEQARVELASLSARFAAANPDLQTAPGDEFGLGDYGDLIGGGLQRTLWILLAAVGCVLLLACVNVAHLLLSRATTRRGEIAIRGALGAGRGRIARQLVTESLVLGVAAAAAGLLVGSTALRWLLALVPTDLPRSADIGLDGPVLAFTLGLGVATGLAFGLVSAWPMLRRDLAPALRGESRGVTSGQRRLRGALVVAEAALALMLLSGAGLLLATFAQLRAVDAGFESRGVLTVSFSRGPSAADAEALWRFQRQALERVRALPGVRAAGTTSVLPLDGQHNIPVTVGGDPDASEGAVQVRAVSPEYLETVRVAVLRGRDFEGGDGAGSSPVALVNESFVERYFPDQDPLGRQLALGHMRGEPLPNYAEAPRTIVGVVADTRDMSLDQPASRIVYVPQAQVPRWALSSPRFVVRAEGTASLEPALRRVLLELDPELAEPRFRPLEEVVGASIAQERFNSTLMGVLAGLALLLTAVGLFGVLSYTVRQRRREIGIRMALGAEGGGVVRMVLRQGLLLVALGVALGTGLSLVMTRLLSGLLYGVAATDPRVYAGAALLLGSVALLASWLPARRAAAVAPMQVLRVD